MEQIGLIIGIVGLVVGTIGIIPIIIEYDNYLQILKNFISTEDFQYDFLKVTYDIQSKEKIRVYKTGKLKVKRKNPTLILGRISNFGESHNVLTKIDNIQIDNSFKKETEHIDLMTRDIFNKRVGETLIIENISEFLLDDNQEDVSEDGFYEIIQPFSCRNLLLSVIFPSDYVPNKLKFAESNLKEGNDKKVRYYNHDSCQLACFLDNRKETTWSIKYPKKNFKYGVYWQWKAQ